MVINKALIVSPGRVEGGNPVAVDCTHQGYLLSRTMTARRSRLSNDSYHFCTNISCFYLNSFKFMMPSRKRLFL